MTQRICSLPDCDGEFVAWGYCDKHYRRAKKYGSPLAGPPPRAAAYPATCTVPDCDQPYAANGYCRRHYMRVRSGGSVTTRAPVSTAIPRGEYVMVSRPGHPLAGSRSRVLLHRVVLYDALGPGDHPCHWCQTILNWDAPRYSPQELQADHLDQDRGNNTPTNLVPSCGPCNTSRSATTRRSA